MKSFTVTLRPDTVTHTELQLFQVQSLFNLVSAKLKGNTGAMRGGALSSAASAMGVDNAREEMQLYVEEHLYTFSVAKHLH